MIGGSPIQPQYYPSAPAYPAYPSSAQQQRPASQSSLVRSTQTAPYSAQVRMQAPEEPELRRQLPPLDVPSADRFGLGAKNRVVEVDWSNVRRRLTALSVASFHLQKLPTGFRFTIVVPTGEHRKFECEAATDADAIEQALAQAEHGR
jgi:hypothetical protein